MDIFYVFSQANDVYRTLVRDNPSVDVSAPGMESLDNRVDFGSGSIPMTLTISPLSKSVANTTTTPLSGYEALPQMVRGNCSEVARKIQAIVGTLDGLGIGLYKQFSGVLSTMISPEMLKKFTAAFEEVILKYKPDINACTMEMKVKITYPGFISCFCEEMNCAAIYRFAGEKLTLSGFDDPSIVNSSPLTSLLSPKVVDVREGVIAETITHAIIDLPSIYRVVDLTEEVNPFIQTTDELLDSLIQKMVLMDVIDALQDVFLDDNTIYLCFDPVMTEDEINVILSSFSQMYPQAMLSNKPDGKDSPWWIIQVSKIDTTASQIAGVSPSDDTVRMGDPGVIAKPGRDPISNIVQGIDVRKTISSVGKG